MTNKLFEHTVLYDSGDAFFELKGNASMKLSPKAAIEVCNEAAKKGLWILGIDGGHWLNPGFRIDQHHGHMICRRNTNQKSLKIIDWLLKILKMILRMDTLLSLSR